MDAPKTMTDMLEELMDAELKQFNRELWNGVRPDKDPIPRGKLERVDRQDVVDLMVQYYSDDAGNVAVQALRNIKQNERAERLMLSLQKVLQPEQEEPGEAPVSDEDLQPIQSDWQRANMITPCSQEFKHRLLKEKRNQIYMPSKRRWKGLALLITNIKFARKENNRDGAERDKKKMEWLLTALGYSVVKYTNLTGKGISRAVRDFSRRHDHKDADSTFVVIMSHGCRIKNKDAISGVKKTKYFVEETFSRLNSANCPALIDKPKVILIQACRGGRRGGVAVKDGESEEDEEDEEEQEDEEDEEEPVQDYVPESDSWVHREKDFVCFMSSLPDISAYRSPDNGSFFINYIVDVFTKWAYKDDIMELFRKVTLRMENDQRFRTERKLLPCIERTSLGRKFYLFPGQ